MFEAAGPAVRVYVRLLSDLLFFYRVQLMIVYIVVPCLIAVCDCIYKYLVFLPVRNSYPA